MSAKLTARQLHQRRVAPLRHGAYSGSPDARRVVYARTWRRVRKLRAQLGPIPPEGEAVLRRLATVQVVTERVFEELAAGGVTTASGEERRLLAEARRWAHEEASLLRELREMVQAAAAAAEARALFGGLLGGAG